MIYQWFEITIKIFLVIFFSEMEIYPIGYLNFLLYLTLFVLLLLMSRLYLYKCCSVNTQNIMKEPWYTLVFLSMHKTRANRYAWSHGSIDFWCTRIWCEMTTSKQVFWDCNIKLKVLLVFLCSHAQVGSIFSPVRHSYITFLILKLQVQWKECASMDRKTN